MRQSRKQYKHSKRPWVTKEILKPRRYQNKRISKLLKIKTDEAYKEYKRFRNRLTNMKETAKASYYKEELSKCGKSKSLKIVNKLLRRKDTSNSLPTNIQFIGKCVDDPFQICQLFNQHFCNIGENMAKKISQISSNNIKRIFGKQNIKFIFLAPTDENEIGDTVDHDRLISKLEHYGIHGIAKDLMKSYFANRK